MIPQLAASIGPKFNRFPCYLQPKLNGVRCLSQIHGGIGIFMSRDEKFWYTPKLRHLQTQLESIKSLIGSRVLDGELYTHGWKLQRINGAVSVNSVTPRHDTHEVEYHIFDIVHPAQTFDERWIMFRTELAAANLSHIKVVPTAYIHDRNEMEQLFKHWTALGYEGVMLRPDGPYVYGQTAHGTRKNSPFLWKYKAWKDGEFLCVGTTQGEGKADIGIGALVLARHEVYLSQVQPESLTFKVGTGFDDNERMQYMQNPPIGKLVKIRYLELTEAGVPFNPSFLCVME
jgi:ATP-dependent DNA ligase